MTRDIDMSDLEREYEASLFEDPIDEEDSIEDQELNDATELLGYEGALDDDISKFSERFYELSLRRFQSESEVDDSLNEILNEMERDFFLKGLWKKVKKGGRALLKKGLKFTKGLPVLKAVKGITQLARGNLKGMLGSLAKAGLGAAVSAIPGGAAIMPALRGLGFETSEDPDNNRDAWNNYVRAANESYEYLASSLTENADNPAEAGRLASEAFRAGLRKLNSTAVQGIKDRRLIQVRKGETIIIKVV